MVEKMVRVAKVTKTPQVDVYKLTSQEVIHMVSGYLDITTGGGSLSVVISSTGEALIEHTHAP